MKLHIGTPNAEGDTHFNANHLNDEAGNDIAMIYGIPQNTTLEEIESSRSTPWSRGSKMALEKARHIVRCVNDRDELIAALSGMCDAVSTQYKSQMIRQHAIDEAFDVATKILKSTMNDPEPKHSPLCPNCGHDQDGANPTHCLSCAWPLGRDVAQAMAFHAIVTTPEPHLLISLSREVHGKHYARSTVANGFIGCIQALAPHGTMDDVRAAVAALAEAEAILEGNL